MRTAVDTSMYLSQAEEAVHRTSYTVFCTYKKRQTPRKLYFLCVSCEGLKAEPSCTCDANISRTGNEYSVCVRFVIVFLIII